MRQSSTTEFSIAAFSFAALLIVIYAGLVFPLIGSFQIGGSSEARESHVMQSIVDAGNWIAPERNGLVPSKPPLHHWIGAAISIAIGRVDELTTRLPSFFAALLLLLVTMIRVMSIARARGGVTAQHEGTIGILAFLILSSSWAFMCLVADSRVDLTCALFVTLAFFSILRRFDTAFVAPRRFDDLIRSQDFTWFYFWCGLAVLTKGPLGIVLPLLIVAAVGTYWSGFRSALYTLIKPRLGWIVFLVVVAPWYAAAIMHWSESFLGRQLLFENIKRFMGGEQVNSEAWWFYFPSFIRTAAPWSLLIIPFAIRDLRASVFKGPGLELTKERLIKVRLLYLVGFVAAFLFFSAASGKRHSYLVPIFPLMTVYLTLALHGWLISQSDTVRAKLWNGVHFVAAFFAFVACSSATVLIALIAQWQPLVTRLEGYVFLKSFFDDQALIFAAAFCIAALGLLWSVVTPRRFFALKALIGSISISSVLITSLLLGMGAKNTLKGFRPIAAAINSIVPRYQDLFAVRTHEDELFDPVLYYLRRPVTLVNPADIIERCVSGRGEHFVLARQEVWEAVRQSRYVKSALHTSFIQPGDHIDKKEDQPIILFRCAGSGERPSAKSYSDRLLES